MPEKGHRSEWTLVLPYSTRDVFARWNFTWRNRHCRVVAFQPPSSAELSELKFGGWRSPTRFRGQEQLSVTLQMPSPGVAVIQGISGEARMLSQCQGRDFQATCLHPEPIYLSYLSDLGLWLKWPYALDIKECFSKVSYIISSCPNSSSLASRSISRALYHPGGPCISFRFHNTSGN